MPQSDAILYPTLPNLPKHPLQKLVSKNLRPRTLRTPSDPVTPPTIPPPPRIPNNLLIQRRAPLCDRPTPTIHNAAPPRPLPRRLDADILGLERPASARRVDGVPYAQRIVQLEAQLGGVLVGVQGEEFLEGGEEEECGPVCEGGVDQRLVCSVCGVEGLWEHVLLGCVCFCKLLINICG